MATLHWIDYLIMLVYFGFVLGIGFALKRFMKTSTDFFLSGRSIPAWVAGLAFISANLGAVEVMGMAASGAQYGISTSHFYWIGAIPAMVFVGIFMMPFYYGSRARSVPEYLRLRFDEKTRAFNAITFAVMTVMASGISMYVMAKLIVELKIFNNLFTQLDLNPQWIFHLSILISALIVLIYIFLGGLTSAIYNEVLQFFLIVAGLFPLVFLGLVNVDGWGGLKEKTPDSFTHAWIGMGDPQTSPMGVEWFGLAMGLGFVLSFGYWCTDFLVVQRAMAADSMQSARRTPLIAAFPKMVFPFLVILPGLIAISVPPRPAVLPQEQGAALTQGRGRGLIVDQLDPAPGPGDAAPTQVRGKGLIPVKINETSGKPELDNDGKPKLDYNLAIPNMLLHYFPTGMLGLGLTALLASFMSGMAGNVTAFNTVWTFDIYAAYLKPNASDHHYLWMGRFTTIFGIAISVAAAYFARNFENIMNLLQLVFAFVNAPLLATFLLGMFWKRTTGHGAFLGLVAGTLAAVLHHGLALPARETVGPKGGWFGVWHVYPQELGMNFWTAIFAWTTCFVVTIAVSLFTRPREDKDLVGLVYSLTPKPSEAHVAWYARPAFLGVVVLVIAILLNIIFM